MANKSSIVAERTDGEVYKTTGCTLSGSLQRRACVYPKQMKAFFLFLTKRYQLHVQYRAVNAKVSYTTCNWTHIWTMCTPKKLPHSNQPISSHHIHTNKTIEYRLCIYPLPWHFGQINFHNFLTKTFRWKHSAKMIECTLWKRETMERRWRV